MSTPRSNITHTPRSNITSTPRSTITNTPRSNIASAPRSRANSFSSNISPELTNTGVTPRSNIASAPRSRASSNASSVSPQLTPQPSPRTVPAVASQPEPSAASVVQAVVVTALGVQELMCPQVRKKKKENEEEDQAAQSATQTSYPRNSVVRQASDTASVPVVHPDQNEDGSPVSASAAHPKVEEQRDRTPVRDRPNSAQLSAQHSPRFFTPRPRVVPAVDSPVKATIRPNRATSIAQQIGAYTLGGRKSYSPQWTNQDAHLAIQLGDGIVFLAVIDGHGQYGHEVAGFVRDFAIQQAKMLVGREPGSTLQQFFRTSQSLLENGPLASKIQYSGATATLAIVDTSKDTMTVAHVGDSRLCVLDATGKPVFETVDHTVSGEEERYILASGGVVAVETICGITARRVYQRGNRYPGLAMSRSLGDRVAHTLGVRAEPAVTTVPLNAGQTVVAASDGVWEHMSADEVAKVVGKNGTSSSASAAQELVEAARRRWSGAPNVDDITSVVFRNPQLVARHDACASPSRHRSMSSLF